jgi:translation initiation factor IF-1
VSGKGAFKVEGRVVTVRGPGLADVELSNGHRLVGHGTRRDARLNLPLAVGMTVTVEITPYDLSKGRIRWKTDLKHESSSLS